MGHFKIYFFFFFFFLMLISWVNMFKKIHLGESIQHYTHKQIASKTCLFWKNGVFAMAVCKSKRLGNQKKNNLSWDWKWGNTWEWLNSKQVTKLVDSTSNPRACFEQLWKMNKNDGEWFTFAEKSAKFFCGGISQSLVAKKNRPIRIADLSNFPSFPDSEGSRPLINWCSPEKSAKNPISVRTPP